MLRSSAKLTRRHTCSWDSASSEISWNMKGLTLTTSYYYSSSSGYQEECNCPHPWGKGVCGCRGFPWNTVPEGCTLRWCLCQGSPGLHWLFLSGLCHGQMRADLGKRLSTSGDHLTCKYAVSWDPDLVWLLLCSKWAALIRCLRQRWLLSLIWYTIWLFLCNHKGKAAAESKFATPWRQSWER